MELDRAIDEIEQEAFPVLESLSEAIRRTIDSRIIRGWIDTSEMHPLITEHQGILYEYKNMRREAHEVLKAKPSSGLNLEIYKTNIDATIEALRDLNRRLDEGEESFVKYNVPRLCMFRSFEAHCKALRAFMRVWREEAAIRRERGEKCLIDWLQGLDQSDDVDKRTTHEVMRLYAVEIGTSISHSLSSYLSFIAVVAENRQEMAVKFQEVYTLFQFLRMENNSIIIKAFLAALEYMCDMFYKYWSTVGDNEKAIAGVVEEKKRSGNGASDIEARSSDLLHLISREVLRLEVAFCCPDLPMMLTNEVFLGMGNHMKQVFDKKQESMNFKVRDLAMEINQSVREPVPESFLFAMKLMTQELQNMWAKLELKPIDK